MKRILLGPFVAWCALAQTPQLKLDHLAAKAKEAVDVTLDSSTLRLAGAFLSSGKGDEGEVKKLIANLKGIVVRSFEFDKEGQYSAADLQPLRALLQGPGWARAAGMESKADRESMEFYTKTEAGKPAGIALITMEPKELTVVYIDGPIDLEQLSGLGGNFGIPQLPGAAGKKKGTK